MQNCVPENYTWSQNVKDKALSAGEQEARACIGEVEPAYISPLLINWDDHLNHPVLAFAHVQKSMHDCHLICYGLQEEVYFYCILLSVFLFCFLFLKNVFTLSEEVSSDTKAHTLPQIFLVFTVLLGSCSLLLQID